MTIPSSNTIAWVSLLLGSPIVSSLITFLFTRKKYNSDSKNVDASTEKILSDKVLEKFSLLIDKYQQRSDTDSARYESLLIEHKKIISEFDEYKNISEKNRELLEVQNKILKVEIRTIMEQNTLLKGRSK
jgi:hypothetical protein